jgi:demethylmenaquinone methyltransferase / 2-methoxy-6-polyprenyl-1,4-benzoquinol methylase
MLDAPTDTNAASFDVFTRIASRYDVLCDLFSLGIHRTWKGAMARKPAGAIVGSAAP